MEKLDNSDWIKLLKENPNPTLKKIYQTYRNDCIHWTCKNYSCSQEDAKDFFQEAIIILYENVKRGHLVELKSKLITYIYGIIKNLALTYKTQQKALLDVSLSTVIKKTHQETKETKQDYGDMLQVLSSLQDPCKTILYSFYFKKMTMTEIADSMNYKNSDVVKSQKYRCTARLFKILMKKRKHK